MESVKRFGVEQLRAAWFYSRMNRANATLRLFIFESEKRDKSRNSHPSAFSLINRPVHSQTQLKMNILDTLKKLLLPIAGLLGYGDEVSLEKDIEVAVASPSEANLDAVLSDAGKVVLDVAKNISPVEVNGFVSIGISAISFAKGPSVKGAETLGGEIVVQLPKVDPKWKITPEHSAALIQALSNCVQDYESSPSESPSE